MGMYISLCCKAALAADMSHNIGQMADDDDSSEKETGEDVPRDLLARRQYVATQNPYVVFGGANGV